ncbi:MAG: hypothetical protein FWD73_16780, partial [Polyangiaceae bacterium]|nr:hypothetical protein [Polyangiaceae bacterium]
MGIGKYNRTFMVDNVDRVRHAPGRVRYDDNPTRTWSGLPHDRFNFHVCTYTGLPVWVLRHNILKSILKKDRTNILCERRISAQGFVGRYGATQAVLLTPERNTFVYLINVANLRQNLLLMNGPSRGNALRSFRQARAFRSFRHDWLVPRQAYTFRQAWSAPRDAFRAFCHACPDPHRVRTFRHAHAFCQACHPLNKAHRIGHGNARMRNFGSGFMPIFISYCVGCIPAMFCDSNSRIPLPIYSIKPTPRAVALRGSSGTNLLKI